MSSELFQVIGTTLRLTDGKIELRLARRSVIQPVPEIWTRSDSTIDASQLEYVAASQKVRIIDVSPEGIIVMPGTGGSGAGYGITASGHLILASTVRPSVPSGPDNPITKVEIKQTVGDEGFGYQMGQLYYGVSGSGGGSYGDLGSFLAAHPGLTFQDFDGVASSGTSYSLPTQDYFGDFGLHPDGTAYPGPATSNVQDDTYFSGFPPSFLPAPFCCVGSNVTIELLVPVNAIGFKLGQTFNGFSAGTVKYYSGATLLYTDNVNPDAITTFSTFSGYATT